MSCNDFSNSDVVDYMGADLSLALLSFLLFYKIEYSWHTVLLVV